MQVPTISIRRKIQKKNSAIFSYIILLALCKHWVFLGFSFTLTTLFMFHWVWIVDYVSLLNYCKSLLFWFILGLKYWVMILYIGILYFLYWVNSYESMSRVYETSTSLRRITSLTTLANGKRKLQWEADVVFYFVATIIRNISASFISNIKLHPFSKFQSLVYRYFLNMKAAAKYFLSCVPDFFSYAFPYTNWEINK